jgi:hypothetical protein
MSTYSTAESLREAIKDADAILAQAVLDGTVVQVIEGMKQKLVRYVYMFIGCFGLITFPEKYLQTQ